MKNESSYMIRWRGRQFGPVPVEEIRRKLAEREFSPWHEALVGGQWVMLQDLDEIGLAAKPTDLPAAGCPPAVRPPQESTNTGCARQDPVPAKCVAEPERNRASDHSGELPVREVLPGIAFPTNVAERRDSVETEPKNRVVYVLLAVALGFTGAHNFYAGYWVRGCIQVLGTLVGFVMGYGWFVTWGWALLETLFIHRDALGVPMALKNRSKTVP